MRLIDADEFEEKINRGDCYGNYGMYEKTDIENAETVDAIPIERLEQEIDRYIDLGLNSVAKELRTIVDDWRKENESNSNS